MRIFLSSLYALVVVSGLFTFISINSLNTSIDLFYGANIASLGLQQVNTARFAVLSSLFSKKDLLQECELQFRNKKLCKKWMTEDSSSLVNLLNKKGEK